jgi:type I restriction enzyme S subunit
MAQEIVIEQPMGWIETSIGDISDYVQRGKGPKYTEKNKFPVVNQKAVRWFGIQEEHLKYVSEEQWDKWTEERFIREGDILWNSTGTGTIGRACYLDANEAAKAKVVDSHVTIVRSNNEICSKYLFYWIMHPVIQGDINGLFNGSTNQVELSKGKVLGTELPLSPLAEQKRIVEKLDSLLAQVEFIQQRLKNLPKIIKRFRQSVLAAAVSGKLTTSNEEQQKAEVGEPWSHEVTAPKHWELSTFKDVVTITGGSQPPKSEFIADNGEGLVRLIQIRDYKSDKFIVYVPKEKVRRFCSASDIMIGRYGPPIFQILRGLEGAYNVALMKADPASEKLDKEFLFRFLQSPTLFNYIDAGSDRTAGQTGVNKKFLENYPIFVPPVEEQTEIVRLVEQHFALADTLEKNLKNAKQRVDNLTQSILAKAFKGELVPQDPNDEPAEQLLARIKAARAEAELLEKAAKKVTSKTKRQKGVVT